MGKALEKSPNGVGGLLGKGPGKGQGGKALFKNMVGNGPKGVKELGKAGPKAAKGAMELLGDMLGKGPGGVKSLGKDPKAAAGTRELVKHGMKNDPAGMKKAMGKGPRAEEGAKELFGNVFGKAKDGLGAFWGKAKGAAKGIFGDALGTAKETAGNVKQTITGTFGELKDAYGENWGAASKQEEAGGKKRSGWDKAWDFAGKIFGTGGKVVQKARTELAAGAVKFASQGVGRVADLVSTGLGDKARAAGGSLSGGVRKIGNSAADFRGDLVHGAIAGDSIKDPNAAQIVGNTAMSFVPVVGQVADARDVVGGMAAKDPARTLFAGLGFIPAAGDALKQSDHIPKLMKHGSKPVDALAGGMKKLIDKVPAGIRKRAGDMWTGAKQKAGDMWTGAKQKAGDMWAGAKQKAGDIWAGAKQKAGDMWAGAKQKAGDMWTGGKQKTTEAKDWLISKFTKGDNKANTKGTSGADEIPSGGFREMMSPEEVARYDKHWEGVADNLVKENVENYRKAILNGDVTKTTGGKIKSKAISSGVDMDTGELYQGISGMKNNPTRNSTNTKMQEILDRVGDSQTNYPLENCAEFNVINNAMNGGVAPENLRIYTIDRVTGKYKAPCVNCENLYQDIVTFIE